MPQTTETLSALLSTKYQRPTGSHSQPAQPVKPEAANTLERIELTCPPRTTDNTTGSVSPEPRDSTDVSSIRLPEVIEALNVGAEYWTSRRRVRYLKMIQDGYEAELLALVEIAHKKAKNPAHYFAHAAGFKKWETVTLPLMRKVLEVQRKAAYLAQRLKTDISKYFYKQVWADKPVDRWLGMALESGHGKAHQSPVKHFAWLCRYGEKLYPTQP